MEFNLTINGDLLSNDKPLVFTTGNVNTYYLKFDIASDFESFSWFCVFKNDDNIIIQPVIGNLCSIPYEILSENSTIFIGCYAISDNNDFKRISTNWIIAHTIGGAYSEGTEPKIPTPDLWETLILKTLPYIGQNGNWYIYNMKEHCYTDSGISSCGPNGYTPIKGVDYYTEADKNDLIESILIALPNGDEVMY